MRWIPGGEFLMGSDRHYPEEAPAYFNPQAIVEKVVNAAAQRHGN